MANGNGALGIFAANHLTELVWGAAAALLIVLSQLPRVGGNTKQRSAAAPRVERESTAANGSQSESTAATKSIPANGARTLVAPAPGTTPESHDATAGIHAGADPQRRAPGVEGCTVTSSQSSSSFSTHCC